MLKTIAIVMVAAFIAGGLLIGYFWGNHKYNSGFKDGVASKPTQTEEQIMYTGEEWMRIRADAVKEYIATHKGKVTVTPQGSPPTTYEFDVTDNVKGYEVWNAEMQTQYEAQISDLQAEIYDLSQRKPEKQRRFGLGPSIGYIYPKEALGGVGISWKKVEVLPFVGYDFDTKKTDYGGLLRMRF